MTCIGSNHDNGSSCARRSRWSTRPHRSVSSLTRSLKRRARSTCEVLDPRFLGSMESILTHVGCIPWKLTNNETQIRDLLATYEQSLNSSDADLAASCYAADGIFMPTTLPTVTGPDMTKGYGQIFDAIRLNVAFTIDELSVTSDDTAYALTRSNGTQTVLATGDESAESNREIFLFERTDTDGWKISHYMFNKPA